MPDRANLLSYPASLVAPLLLLACLVLQTTPALSQQTLDVLARVGPWPTVSHPIVYKGRLWFANSVKGRNHNSADIWSLDPATGGLRYERHLFSQDAGGPLVFRGLLHWPHEDPRLSIGYGAIAVTDGEKWTELEIRAAQIFHTHHVLNWRGTLLAVTSAWRAGLQVSDDAGSTWDEYYDHPTPPKRVSRLLSPAVIGGRLYFRLRDPDGTRMVRIGDKTTFPVNGWPDRTFRALTAYGTSMFAIVGRPGAQSVWRSDGRRSGRLSNVPKQGRPVNLYATRDRLWALFAQGDGGYVASSVDGTAWTVAARFEGGRPNAVLKDDEQIIVTGSGQDGKGIVWGRQGVALPSAPDLEQRELPRPPDVPLLIEVDWQQQSERLKRELLNPTNFHNHGREGLRDIVKDLVSLAPPRNFFIDLLDAPMPETTVAVIGGESHIPAGTWVNGYCYGRRDPTAMQRFRSNS